MYVRVDVLASSPGTQAAIMAVTEGDIAKGLTVPHIPVYVDIMSTAEHRAIEVIKYERMEFYEQAKKCYAVIATSDCMPCTRDV